MIIRKAVITAAGRGTRHYPASSILRKELFPIVDRDGITKPVIHFIIEEALESGIEEICIVTDPGGDADFRRYFNGLAPEELSAYKSKPWALELSGKLKEMEEHISYAMQETQDGYGHAVYCSKDFVGDEPFLLMLGDHIYLSKTGRRCARQLIDIAGKSGASAAAVQRTPESLLHLFGTVTGRMITDDPPVYELTEIVEKPSINYAQSKLRTPDLPPDTYLCLFGIQCLSPTIFDFLGHHIKNDLREKGEIQLTSSLEMLRQKERFLAVEVDGERYDVGVPEGYLETIIALQR